MSKETICDICGDVVDNFEESARTSIPFRYKVYERVARTANYDRYRHVEKDLCADCRKRMEALLQMEDDSLDKIFETIWDTVEGDA